jgi:hypothetical protein
LFVPKINEKSAKWGKLAQYSRLLKKNQEHQGFEHRKVGNEILNHSADDIWRINKANRRSENIGYGARNISRLENDLDIKNQDTSLNHELS